MAIQFSVDAPANGIQRIRSHYSRVRENPAASGFRELRRQSDIHASHGIQLWTLDLDKNPVTSSDAYSTGEWRYLIAEGSSVIAEVQLNEGSDDEEITSVLNGPSTTSIPNALNVSALSSPVEAADFEPRLLLIPALPVTALWLHSDSAEDLFVAIAPSIPRLTQDVLLSEADFMSVIQEESVLARNAAEQFPGPSGGSSGSLGGLGINSRVFNLTLTGLNLESLEDALDEDASGGSVTKELPQFMQGQLQTNWCWSAVGTSVGLFFGTGNWTQCDTASGCLPGQTCCRTPGSCNVYGYLDKSLTYTRSFNFMVARAASMQDIQAEINTDHPLCARVAWNGAGAHFMAISGYDGNYITIQDSIYGTTKILHNAFPSKYQGGGKWTHSYFCKY